MDALTVSGEFLMHKDIHLDSLDPGHQLLDVKALREDMQARRQRAFSNNKHLRDVEQVFIELSDKHGFPRHV